MNKLILLNVILLIVFSANAQKLKNVLEKPAAFAKPIDESALFYNYNNKIKRDRLDDSPWEVYSDRVGNVTDSGDTLDFKDSYYVVDETDTKIRLISALLDGTKITEVVENHGWIAKAQMLLWSDVLIDPVTKIQRKGFLLNTRESLDRIIRDPNDKSKVRIYDRPDMAKAGEIEKNRIYEFYFIIKKERAPGSTTPNPTSKDYMYLLSRNVRVGGFSISNDLVGWVRGDRIDEWNTRIALEPNFEPAAIKERKSNENKDKILAFSIADEAKEYAFSNKYDPTAVLWDNDPIMKSADKLSNEDPFRFKGGVIRFPMLKKDTVNNYFKTAIVGEITLTSLEKVVGNYDIIEYANISKEIERLNKAKQNVNIIYIIEGNKVLNNYVPVVSESITEIKKIYGNKVQLKFGAAVIKDYQKNKPSVNVSRQELTTDKTEIDNFLKSVQLDTYNNPEQDIALYHGIETTLNKIGIRKDQTNIVILLAKQPDIENTPELKTDTLFRVDFFELVDELTKHNVHFVAANLAAKNDALSEQLSSMILETAKTNFNEYKNIGNLVGLSFANPDLVEEKNQKSLINGTTYGSIKVIDKQQDLLPYIKKSVKETKKFVDGVVEESNQIFEDGKEAYVRGTAGQFGPAIADLIIQNLSFLSEDEMKDILKEKYQLYFRSFVPVKMAQNKNECFSYVLFMPEEDLESLFYQLQRLSNSVNETPDKKREALIRVWKELVLQFTGEDEDKIMNLDLQTIEQKMQGVKNEGITFDTNKPLARVKLKDLLNRKKISDQQIDDYIEYVQSKYQAIEAIIQKGKAYDFAYSSNGYVYYWIPSNYLP